MTMTEYVLSIDCGLSTGIALLSYEEDSPAELVEGWQFNNGVTGLVEWIRDHDYGTDSLGPVGLGGSELTVIAEKFTARNTKGFAYTTASLEALPCEGALQALWLMPKYTVAEKRWRDPSLQYFVGGKDLADKKKRQHRFLEESGFYRTNKDFPDSPPKDKADDFRSACAHGINYIARELRHRPTFDMIAAWGEEN